ncbi:MAG: alkylhydroperoxidase [Betaproteobacteria bacterium]|nr:alkylhydroperoxidase [Betaproteobacteria bacterium]
MSAWIRMVPLAEATGKLKELYQRVTTPHGTVDNVMRAHSLRPHTMEGHLVLYKSVLHNPDNTLPFWFLELIASYVSMTNRCDYSLTHHFTNARRLINDKARSDAIHAALAAGRPEEIFEGKQLALLRYARKLTAEVGAMVKADMDTLHEAGCDDGEILEVNQVCAYFNYSNRLLNGLGVTTEGDVIGYYAEDAAASAAKGES